MTAEDLLRITDIVDENYGKLNDDNETKQQFISVFKSLSKKHLLLFMKFISGSSRIREGFNTTILVHIGTSPSDRDKIPSSSTCFRRLYLSNAYESEESLRKKLIYALENCNEIAEIGNAYDLEADFGL